MAKSRKAPKVTDLQMSATKSCDVCIDPGRLSGAVAAIPSKSYAQRILIAAALADEPTTVQVDYLSDDVLATIGALQSMGAGFKITKSNLTVSPITDLENVAEAELVADCKESGTTARLLLPILASLFDKGTLTGAGSLLNRPFGTLCSAIEDFKPAKPFIISDEAATVHPQTKFDSHRLPISWTDHLQPGHYQLPGDESSQYLSALLFALPLLQESSSIRLTGPLQSAGYVDITEEVLRNFGVSVGHEYHREISYQIRPQTFRSPGYISVEGDWSNAAFWLAAGVEVTGLNPVSFQRDRNFSKLKNQPTIDATDVPDLVPILAVCASLQLGTTCITGINRLRIKESDRIETTLAMLRALGCGVELSPDCDLLIHGTGTIPGGSTVDGANDHRIVMAAAIAASFALDSVTITGAQAVAKTYPNFFSEFERLGGVVHVA